MENELDNDKREIFCLEYLVSHNATQAALKAGYSPKTAYSQGHRLLKNDEVRERVEQLQKERCERLLISADDVLLSLIDTRNRCKQAVPVMVWSSEEKCMVQAVDEEGRAVYQFDSSGANRADELIGKGIGMFTTRHEVNVPGLGIIQPGAPSND